MISGSASSPLRHGATALALAALPTGALAGPCLEWQAPEKVGSLDPAFLREASGLAASRAHPGRLYHHNDSGDGPHFYVTDASGAKTRRIAVSGFKARDMEDMAIGACAGAKSCLVLGDIGDNERSRATVTFALLAEQASFPDAVVPLRTIEARYPDGAHDAESIALDPSGDLYLITKAIDLKARTSAGARIYRLTAAQLSAPSDQVQTFTHIGTLDLPALITNMFAAQAATGMDISADGKRAVLLTYGNIFEWNRDLSRKIDPAQALKHGTDYTVVAHPQLMQTEAIAYVPDVDGVLFTTELNPAQTAAPLYRQMCLKR